MSEAPQPTAPGAGEDGQAEEIVLSSQDGRSHPVDDNPAHSLDEVFDRWFQRFNDGETTPGFISWQQADELLTANPKTADAAGILLAEVGCATRHMHARPTALPPDWLWSGRYVLDTDRFRAKPASLTSDNPQDWFGVEVDEQGLRTVIAAFLQDEPPAELEPAPPASASPPPLEASASPAGAWASAAELALHERHQLPIGSTEHCPPGYRVVQTPEGFVAVWYGPVRASEAAAVADTWRNDQ